MPDCGIMPRMDIRILRYFIAVAEEGNITKAAARLHVSQPALSTQLAALEDELGQRLFERGARGIELTEKGLVLKRRADDLVDFAERIESEMKANGGDELEGTVSIGAGETPAFRFVARAAAQLARDNPRLRFSISSGNGEDVLMHLREGVHDLALLVGPGRYEGFDYLTLPYMHRWGLLVSSDSPLTAKKHIVPSDTKGIPLISSRQGMVREFIAGWLGFPYSRLNVVATYNLFYNAVMFVEAGIGAAICIDGVVPHEFAFRVAFRPFSPALTSDVYLAWRKNAALSPAAAALVETIRAAGTRQTQG